MVPQLTDIEQLLLGSFISGTTASPFLAPCASSVHHARYSVIYHDSKQLIDPPPPVQLSVIIFPFAKELLPSDSKMAPNSPLSKIAPTKEMARNNGPR